MKGFDFMECNSFVHNVILSVTNMDEWCAHIEAITYKYSKTIPNILNNQTEGFLKDIFDFKFDFVALPT